LIKEHRSGWWYGEIHSSGIKGWFPSTYVKDPTRLVARDDFFSGAFPSARNLLIFPGGAQIKLIADLGGGWYKGEYNGNIGCFPSAWVQHAA
jgi:hypothetical protein